MRVRMRRDVDVYVLEEGYARGSRAKQGQAMRGRKCDQEGSQRKRPFLHSMRDFSEKNRISKKTVGEVGAVAGVYRRFSSLNQCSPSPPFVSICENTSVKKKTTKNWSSKGKQQRRRRSANEIVFII